MNVYVALENEFTAILKLINMTERKGENILQFWYRKSKICSLVASILHKYNTK